jgi:hypothetical protein
MTLVLNGSYAGVTLRVSTRRSRSFRAVSEAPKCEKKVGLEEIAIDLLQARFWIVSVLPTICPESSCTTMSDEAECEIHLFLFAFTSERSH